MLLTDLQVYPPYYQQYFVNLSRDFPLQTYLESRMNFIEQYESIPEDKWSYSYAEGKWTIQKVVQHILDAELIFCYRALSIVRGEKNKLIGWSENEYAAAVEDSRLSKEWLIKSLKLQFEYTAHLFSSFDSLDLKKIGNMNNVDSEVGGIGFAIIAHEIHHRGVIKNVYFSKM